MCLLLNLDLDIVRSDEEREEDARMYLEARPHLEVDAEAAL